VAAARADLFHKALVAITPPPGTPEAAIQLSSDLVVLLGATPFFMELAEVDGVMAAARLLPELSAAALVETLTSQPGWPDIRKLAGSDYASTTRPLETDGASAWAETFCTIRQCFTVLDAISPPVSAKNHHGWKGQGIAGSF
jgi:prephenate dehydrogenase